MDDYIWVVQMKGKTCWLPTSAAGLSKNEAAHQMYLMGIKNPDDEFRVVKYVPKGDRPWMSDLRR